MDPVLQSLIAFIEDDLRVYDLSRRVYFAPSERARRIQERRAWIAAIRALSGEPPREETPPDVPRS